MYAILHLYQAKAHRPQFPLKIKYAIAFPECSQIAGIIPADLDRNSIFLFGDLENLEDKLLQLFEAPNIRYEREAVDLLITRVLAPSFQVFA